MKNLREAPVADEEYRGPVLFSERRSGRRGGPQAGRLSCGRAAQDGGREHSGREESFIDWAKASTPARYAFRGGLFGTRLASVVAPKLPTFLIGHAARRFPELVNMGAMTIVSNIYGNPAVSIPAGTVNRVDCGAAPVATPRVEWSLVRQ